MDIDLFSPAFLFFSFEQVLGVFEERIPQLMGFQLAVVVLQIFEPPEQEWQLVFGLELVHKLGREWAQKMVLLMELKLEHAR